MDIDTLISDFDKEIQNRIYQMRSGAEIASANLTNAFNVLIKTIPKNVLQMPMKSLLDNFQGNINDATSYLMSPKSTPTKKPQKIPMSPSSSKKAIQNNISLSNLLNQSAKQLSATPRTHTPSKCSHMSTTLTRTPGSPSAHKSPASVRKGTPARKIPLTQAKSSSRIRLQI